MRPFRALVPIAIAAATASLPAQSPGATIDRAVAAWGAAHTARATFEQTLTNPLTGGSATSRGVFLQQRPGRLAIRFTDPDGDRIIADGKSVWIYLPSSAPDQVIRRSATDDGAAPIDIASQFLDSPREKYTIADAGTATVAGGPAHVLALTPKRGSDAPFAKAKVWVSDSDGLIRQFEVVEPSGLTRKVRLTSIDLDVPVDASAFTFTPPKGVKIVER